MTRSATQRQPQPPALPVGVLATITMDAAMIAAALIDRERFESEKLAPEMIGRWVAAGCRGRWRHDDLGSAPPAAGETAIGMAAHYATGISLTYGYFLLLRVSGLRSGLGKASAFGAATALLPFLVMYPAWGYGAFGLRDDDAARLARVMLLGHTAFGVGIGVWAAALQRRRPRLLNPAE